MNEANHYVIFVKSKQPLVDWANSIDPEFGLTVAEANKDATAFVLPELDGEQEVRDYVQSRWKEILETELESWFPKKTWPSLTEEIFESFITIEYSSMVYHL